MIIVYASQNGRAWIPTKLKRITIEVPVYPLSIVPELNCAKYARLAALELFRKTFTACSAWNRRYHDRLVASVNGQSLKTLADERTIRSGMILGIFNPDSDLNGKERDERNNLVQYTHNVLMLGRNQNDEPMFAEQVEERVLIRTGSELSSAGFNPIEIFDQPRNRSH